MTSQLLGSDFTDGALLPHYVNGRVLVAEDLATSQTTLRTRDAWIGEAAGAGVVRGLWVSNTATTLTVAAGLGLGAGGEPVVVSAPVTLQLTFATAAAAVDHADFSCCGAAGDAGQDSSLTTGILLLTVRPACRLEGQAPVAAPPGGSVSPCCAAQWRVEGAEFRAIALPVPPTVAGTDVTRDNRRNLVAHWCYGSEALAKLGVDPFGFDPAYSGLAQLSPEDLSPDDVPLAVFAWTGTAVEDLDNWSARRRVTTTSPVISSWTVTVSDARVADGEARFLQFQDQAESLVSAGVAASAQAADYFGLLPPVGFLPVGSTPFQKVAKNAYRASLEAKSEAAAREASDPAGEQQLPEAETMWRQPARSLRAEETTDIVSGQHPLGVYEYDSSVFKDLYEVAESTSGYGFDPEQFFGSLAAFGGFLDWELAEWALDQSWRARPVSTRNMLESVEEESADEMATRIGRRIHRMTYYYVLQNIAGAEVSTKQFRSRPRKQRFRSGLVSANLYVVFVANRVWASNARLPIISPGLLGDLADVR